MAFALIQEPYVGGVGRMRDYNGVRIYQCTDQTKIPVKAAIVVFDNNLDVIQYPECTTTNIVVIKLKTSAWEMIVVSFYFEPFPKPLQPYLDQLKLIEQKFGHRIIMGGDTNAKSSWWGSTKVDERGEEMAGVLEEMGLQVLNEGTTPTFFEVRGDKICTSFVDVTACTLDVLDLIEDWRVDEEFTSSDHNALIFR